MRPEQQQVLIDWARAVGLTQMHGRKAIYERFCELVEPLGHKVPSLPAIDKWIERGVIPWRWQIVLGDLRRQVEGDSPPPAPAPAAPSTASQPPPSRPTPGPITAEPQTERTKPMSNNPT